MWRRTSSGIALRSSWVECDNVFTEELGRPLIPRTDWARWKRLVAAAGVRDARLHDTRYTAATMLLLLGVLERGIMSSAGRRQRWPPGTSTSFPPFMTIWLVAWAACCGRACRGRHDGSDVLDSTDLEERMPEGHSSGCAVVPHDTARQLRHADGRDYEVVVSVVPDEGELRRREQHRVRPILGLSLLNVLVRIPLSSPVSADDVSDYDWQLLQLGSRVGAVEIISVNGVAYATRRAKPPLKVQHVTVRAARWRWGLQLASRFAPYSSRELVLDRAPSNDVELRLEADYLGVGVTVIADIPGGSTRRIVEPAPFRPARLVLTATETTIETIANTPVRARCRGPAFALVGVALAEGFEPSGAFTSNAFAFCGRRIGRVR